MYIPGPGITPNRIGPGKFKDKIVCWLSQVVLIIFINNCCIKFKELNMLLMSSALEGVCSIGKRFTLHLQVALLRHCTVS